MSSSVEQEKKNSGVVTSVDTTSDFESPIPEPTTLLGRLDKFITVKESGGKHAWSNPDMEPTPLDQQTWRPYHFLAYWLSDSYSASSWRSGGSFIKKGLTPGLIYGCDLIGKLVTASVVTTHGLVGGKYHIPFSVQARASFGFYFSYVVVIMRFIVGCYYYGINAYTGAECIQTIIISLSPRFANMADHISSDSTSSSMMLCYFIYNVICIPFHYIHANHIKKFLLFKMFTGPTVGVALMIYLNTKAGGVKAIWDRSPTVHGSELSWLIFQCITNSIASYSTICVNVNDFTRYSANKYASFTQLYAIPLDHVVLSPMGVVGGMASTIIYGETLWDPLLIAQEWMDTSGGRAAAFFVSLSFLIAQIGINISANSISAANDLTALFPKYINIRRGQYIVMILGGWALCPWEVIANATTLTAFMGGYSIFLGPIAAVMVCDYFIVNKRKYDINEFYNVNGIYRYGKFGTNWRAVCAMIVGFAPLLPGLASYINTNIVMPTAVLHLYLFGYLYSFPSAFLVYYVLSKFWPNKEAQIDEAVLPPAVEFNPLTEEDLEKSKAYQRAKTVIRASIF